MFYRHLFGYPEGAHCAPLQIVRLPIQSKPASDLKLIAFQEVSERSKRIVVAVKLASACRSLSGSQLVKIKKYFISY